MTNGAIPLKNSESIGNVLLIGGSSDSVALAKALKVGGFSIILVDIDLLCVARSYCDVFINLSTFDYEDQIILLKKYEIYYCVTRSSGIAAKNCFQLNELIRFKKKTTLSDDLLDKSKLPDFCAEHNILHPITTLNIGLSGVNKLDYPIILKPIYEIIGKITTFKIANNVEMTKLVEKSDQNSHVNQSIVQQYLDGDDYSLLGFSHYGVYCPFGLFRERNNMVSGKVQHDGFVLLDKLLMDPFIKIAEVLASAIEIPLCPLNMGFRVCEGRIFLLECNLDFGGEGVIEILTDFNNDDVFGQFVSKICWKHKESG